MVVSNNTVEDLIKAIRRYVDEKTMDDIMEDLSKIEGNASFRETVIKMKHNLMRMREREAREGKKE